MEYHLHSNLKVIHETFSDDLGSRNIFEEIVPHFCEWVAGAESQHVKTSL
jgi:hypothetical protein